MYKQKTSMIPEDGSYLNNVYLLTEFQRKNYEDKIVKSILKNGKSHSSDLLVKSAKIEKELCCYKCPKCCYKTEWGFALNHHMKQHHPKVVQETFSCASQLNKYSCSKQCLFIAELKTSLSNHIIEEHKFATATTYWKIRFKSKPSNSGHSKKYDLKPFRCHRCQLRTFSLLFLKKHFETCNKCKFCEYIPKRKRDLQRHYINKHANNQIKWFKCTICDFKTKQATCLKNHNVSKHTIEWLECNLCNYKAKHLRYLQKHINNKHSEIKFKSKEKQPMKILKQHITQPNQETEIFKCQLCDFQTTRNLLLKQHHMYKHVSDVEIKWFECQFCEFRSKFAGKLKTHHINKHVASDEIKWFQCKDCEYKAKHKIYLTKHIANKHTERSEVNWFQCSFCDHKTKRKEDLKMHNLNKHMDESQAKRFACPFCEYRAKHNAYIKKHVARRHPQET